MKENTACRHRRRTQLSSALLWAGALIASAQAQSEEATPLLDVTNSNLHHPFLGAYIHLPRILRDQTTNEERERTIDDALDHLRATGFRVAMPYVTTTSGAALYPSRITREHPFSTWDPLAHLLQSAHARKLDVHPVVCVLASGHHKPAGILSTHPEWALRTPEGEPMGHICPAHPEARRWVTSVTQPSNR